LADIQSASDIEHQSAEDAAASVLDRVKMMRVFDLVGITEAISEIREETSKSKTTQTNEAERVAASEANSKAPSEKTRKTVIADSEDEDENEELLFDNEPVSMEHSVSPNTSDTQQKSNQSPSNRQAAVDDPRSNSRLSIVLVDNLARVVNPLLKKDYIQCTSLSTLHVCITNLMQHILRPHLYCPRYQISLMPMVYTLFY
jgi:hypothetical protein